MMFVSKSRGQSRLVSMVVSTLLLASVATARGQDPGAIPSPTPPAAPNPCPPGVIPSPPQQPLDQTVAEMSAKMKDLAAAMKPGPISGLPAPGPQWTKFYNLNVSAIPADPNGVNQLIQPPVFPVPANTTNNVYEGYSTTDANGKPVGITVSYPQIGPGTPTITQYSAPVPDPQTGVLVMTADTYDANGNFIGNTTITYAILNGVTVVLETVQNTWGLPNASGSRSQDTTTSVLCPDMTYSVYTNSSWYIPAQPGAADPFPIYFPPIFPNNPPVIYNSDGTIVPPAAPANPPSPE